MSDKANNDELWNLFHLHRTLSQDVEQYDKACLDRALPLSTQQFWRRGFVRAVFAFVEGITYGMKQTAYEARRFPFVQHSPADVAMLSEEVYELNSKGEAFPKAAKLSLKSNLKFAFRKFAESFDAVYELKVSGQGWEAFLKAVKLRDRLMHPKRHDDVVVSDDELENTVKAYNWFLDSFDECRAHSVHAAIQYAERFQEEQQDCVEELRNVSVDLGQVESNIDDIDSDQNPTIS